MSRKVLIGALSITLLLPAAWAAAAWYASGIAATRASQSARVFTDPHSFALHPIAVEFPATDGVPIHAWWTLASNPRAIVVLAHGGQHNHTQMSVHAAFLADYHYESLMLDLRNHGESGGDVTSWGHLEAQDLLGALDFIHKREPSQPVALYGYSLGAVAAIHAAAQSADVGMVILDSPYADMEETIQPAAAFGAADEGLDSNLRLRLWALAHLPGLIPAATELYRWRAGAELEPPKTHIRKVLPWVTAPYALMLVSEHDPILPEAKARELLSLLASPHKHLALMPGARHNALPEKVRPYASIVISGLDEAFPPRS